MASELDRLFLVPYPMEQDGLNWKAFSKALLNASPNCVFATDRSGTVIISNQVTQTNFGLFPGTRIATTMPDFWPIVENTIRDHEYRSGVAIHSDNASFMAKVCPIAWEDAIVGVLCIFEDRTELEKMTRKMMSFQELSQELDTIINSTNDGLWICDGKARVIRINPASERINNVRADEVVGRTMPDLVDEGFIDRSVTLDVIRKRKKVSLLQTTKDGNKLIITGNPIFDTTGRLNRVVVNEQDITEIDGLRRELEERNAFKESLQHQMLEMQLADLESTNIIARSPVITTVIQQAIKVSHVDSTVLILGESGTGKELIAELIHKYSEQSNRPLIKINCGAIPETLVESELFGYEKGAFTGARAGGKPGHLELSDHGILFLDEIAELPLSVQVKLLRFLEDGRVTRVGGTSSRQLNVRILAATNRNLEDMVTDGEFRQDLFYRLHVIPLRIPPLRKRRDCILPLIYHYVEHFRKRFNIKRRIRFASKAIDALLAYPYPGNVRELVNMCERVVVMSEEGLIKLENLPKVVTQASSNGRQQIPNFDNRISLHELLNTVERQALANAVEKHGTQTAAAIALGVNQSTIARKLKKHGLIP